MSIQELNDLLDDGLAVYRYYIGEQVRLKKKILSPLPQHNEKDPSFALYRGRNGQVRFSDFGLPAHGNHWDFVMMMNDNCTFPEAVRFVKEQILGIAAISPETEMKIQRLRMQPRTEKEEEHPVRITPRARSWRESDLRDFVQYGISLATLQAFDTIPTEKYLLEKGESRQVITEAPGDPIYAFLYNSSPEGSRYKMYRPHTLNKKKKWVSNLIGNLDHFGYKLLPPTGKKLFITAGNKDTMSFYEQIQLPCFPLNSEQGDISIRLLTDLRLRFDELYSVYDDDEAGRNGAAKLWNEYRIRPCNKPILAEGVNDFALLIQKVLSNPQALQKVRDYFWQ